jgi:hypothetical protein
LRDLGRRKLPSDELPETIVAEMIVEHLLRCRWRIERPAPSGAQVAR